MMATMTTVATDDDYDGSTDDGTMGYEDDDDGDTMAAGYDGDGDGRQQQRHQWRQHNRQQSRK